MINGGYGRKMVVKEFKGNINRDRSERKSAVKAGDITSEDVLPCTTEQRSDLLTAM